MSAQSKDTFIAIYRRLQGCETREEPITEQQVDAAWMELVQSNGGTAVLRSVMAALLLYDDAFKALLTTGEWNQLSAIVKKAVDQYERQLHPHTEVGLRLADAINTERKEEI